MSYKKSPQKWIWLILFGCIFLYACSNEKKMDIGTDVAFVEEQFPQIENIEEVRYFYNVKSNKREIGLQNIEFCGFIKIGEDFYKKITREYEWKETKKSKKKVPKALFTEGDDQRYQFSYNYDFSYDGKYKSHSWGGDFYLDKEKRLLYFECDW